MTCRGIVKGKFIELETALPDFEGQSVDISLQPTRADDAMGSPARILQAMGELEDLKSDIGDEAAGSPALLLKAMREPPHVDPTIVDELERVIAESRMPVRYEGIFDVEADQ